MSWSRACVDMYRFILYFVLATFFLFTSSYNLNRTDKSDEYSNVCPFKRIMDHLFIDAEKSLLAVRHLKAKLVSLHSSASGCDVIGGFFCFC